MNNTVPKKINTILKFVYSDANSLSIIFHDNDLLMGVVGEFNENLKELEKITSTSLYSRGNSILIKSTPEKNEITKNAIQFLATSFCSGVDLIIIEFPLEYKLVLVIFSSSFRFSLNSPTTPISKSLSRNITLNELLSEYTNFSVELILFKFVLFNLCYFFFYTFL